MMLRCFAILEAGRDLRIDRKGEDEGGAHFHPHAHLKFLWKTFPEGF